MKPADLIAPHVRKLDGYTPGEQPRSKKVVKLNTNENPYPPSPKVATALAAFSADSLRLYPDPMAVAVRRRIAAIHKCSVDNVFAGNGSDELLALATRAFVGDKGTVACFDPSYSLYPVLAAIRNAGCKLLPLDSKCDKLPTNASLLFLTNPNAPTGTLMERRRVEAICRSFKGVVVIDEAYADFASRNCMDLAVADGNRNVIVTRTLSKSFSLAGIRFGYAVGPAELIEAMYKIKDSYNLDGVTQAVALAALNDLPYMRANAKKIVATREATRKALSSLGWTIGPSETNFLLASPPFGNAEEIFNELRKRNVFVRFFKSLPRFLRITIGTPEQMEILIKELKRI